MPDSPGAGSPCAVRQLAEHAAARHATEEPPPVGHTQPGRTALVPDAAMPLPEVPTPANRTWRALTACSVRRNVLPPRAGAANEGVRAS